MKNYCRSVVGAFAVVVAVVAIVMAGCMPPQQTTQTPSNPNMGRWQIFGTQTGAFLVDTQTGEAYVFIPAALSWALCNRVQVSFGQPPGAGTTTPTPPKPPVPAGSGR